jgi:hypothetical protein
MVEEVAEACKCNEMSFWGGHCTVRCHRNFKSRRKRRMRRIVFQLIPNAMVMNCHYFGVFCCGLLRQRVLNAQSNRTWSQRVAELFYLRINKANIAFSKANFYGNRLEAHVLLTV